MKLQKHFLIMMTLFFFCISVITISAYGHRIDMQDRQIKYIEKQYAVLNAELILMTDELRSSQELNKRYERLYTELAEKAVREWR